MMRWISRALALTAGGMFVASAAVAGTPSFFSTFDAVGVGTNSGAAIGGSPAGFDVTVKDGNDQLIPGAVVSLDFAGSGVRAYAVQNPGTTVNAAAQALTRVAVTGTVNFAARTGGFTNTKAVQVAADGVVLGFVKWRSTDIDAVDGKTGLSDLSYLADRYLLGATAPECNLDLSFDDVTHLSDLTLEAAEYLSSVSGTYAW